MDYQETVEWLERLTNPERTGLGRRFAKRMSLEATRRLMELLGNPERQIRAVHVAGTKGKGSVAAMIEAALRAGGRRTGLFTSPHLVSWRERIRIDGRCVEEETVAELATEVRPAVERVGEEGLRGPSFFEALTAMAFLCFARAELDICVLEVGLGGRLDATNVVKPELSVITTLGMDHMKVLGNTLPAIATQKAGIIKPSVPVVAAPQPESIERLMRRRAADVGAPISFVQPLGLREVSPLRPEDVGAGELPVIGERVFGEFGGEPFEAQLTLAGRHQALNAAVAARCCEMLEPGLSAEELRAGFESLRWPARAELAGAHPWVVIDCAHNQASARVLMAALRRHLQYERMILVLGVSKDKPVEEMAVELASADHAILTEASLSRALPVEYLEERTASVWRSSETIISPVEALMRAREMAGTRDLICVTGSFFIIDDLIRDGALTINLPCL